MSDYIDRFTEMFRDLKPDSFEAMASIYDPEVVFQDPAHQIVGRENLTRYFEELCGSLLYCRFDISRRANDGDSVFLEWEMSFAHPKLSSGKCIVVPGVSVLKLSDNGICSHRDYFDMGAMLYEKLPMLGSVVSYLKNRLAA
ncbi:nuclear transport factor 2 family protein [Corallincola platygyrae]|uniref:Nuclear transport factor 2 family protein n=1 Tax=Corallincola platygyrae TaxID=1193278 RepID=A0ABW4XL12_9GAMM